MLTIGPMNDLPRIRHAFFERTGGVSVGLYTSLNCGFGSGDEADRVAENRAHGWCAPPQPPSRGLRDSCRGPQAATSDTPGGLNDSPGP
jgi:hypothetical protein